MNPHLLREAADKVVAGSGKFEQLMVASQGIAASTAQLVVASRVKAERTSTNLSALSEASRDVTQATGTVVATAKSCSALVEENGNLVVVAYDGIGMVIFARVCCRGFKSEWIVFAPSEKARNGGAGAYPGTGTIVGD